MRCIDYFSIQTFFTNTPTKQFWLLRRCPRSPSPWIHIAIHCNRKTNISHSLYLDNFLIHTMLKRKYFDRCVNKNIVQIF